MLMKYVRQNFEMSNVVNLDSSTNSVYRLNIRSYHAPVITTNDFISPSTALRES